MIAPVRIVVSHSVLKISENEARKDDSAAHPPHAEAFQKFSCRYEILDMNIIVCSIMKCYTM